MFKFFMGGTVANCVVMMPHSNEVLGLSLDVCLFTSHIRQHKLTHNAAKLFLDSLKIKRKGLFKILIFDICKNFTQSLQL